MPNPEVTLFTLAVKERKLGEILKAGARVAHMGSPQHKEALTYLIDFYNDGLHPGAIPSPDQFMQRFPFLQPEPVPEGVTPESVVHEVATLGLNRELLSRINVLQTTKRVAEPEDLEEVIQELRNVLGMYTIRTEARGSESAAGVRTWYDEGKDNTVTGLPFPWELLNIPTRGIQPADFILFYGRPKVGKTMLLLMLLVHLLETMEKGSKFLFVSYEMSLQRLMNRLACLIGKIDYKRFNESRLSDEESATLDYALQHIRQLKEEFGKDVIFTGPAIRGKQKRKSGFSILDVEQVAEENEVKAIFVDGFIHAQDTRTGKRSREWTVASNISSDLKQIAVRLNVPVIGSHQANRESEKEVQIGTQKDIAYSDALAQDTDLSMRVSRVKDHGELRTLVQTEGAREFQMLGFLLGAHFCEDVNWRGLITDEKTLRELLRKEVTPIGGAKEKTTQQTISGLARKSAAEDMKQEALPGLGELMYPEGTLVGPEAVVDELEDLEDTGGLD